MVNPKSIANLRPFQPGQSGNPAGNPVPGPKIAPAMHRYADMSFEELVELAASEEAKKLPMKDIIAITSLMKAAKDVPWGDKMREFVAQRLDGDGDKGDTYNDNRVTIIREVHTTIAPVPLG